MSSDNTSTGPGRPRIPDDDLEEEFHRVASLDEVDGTPSYRDMEEYGNHSASCYTDRHGGWDATAIHYGYEPNETGNRISGDQLEADFHEFAAELGGDRGPHRLEMDEDGPHTYKTYCDHIGGTWDDVLLHYGYEPNKRFFAYSEGAVREIMHRIAIETERPPEPEDVPEDVREDILKRWGSWWVAQAACCVTKYDLEMAFSEGDSE